MRAHVALLARLISFKRRDIRITEAGEVLFKYVQQALGGLDDARNDIAALHNEVRGRLVVGTSETAPTYYRMCYRSLDAAIPV